MALNETLMICWELTSFNLKAREDDESEDEIEESGGEDASGESEENVGIAGIDREGDDRLCEYVDGSI